MSFGSPDEGNQLWSFLEFFLGVVRVYKIIDGFSRVVVRLSGFPRFLVDFLRCSYPQARTKVCLVISCVGFTQRQFLWVDFQFVRYENPSGGWGASFAVACFLVRSLLISESLFPARSYTVVLWIYARGLMDKTRDVPFHRKTTPNPKTETPTHSLGKNPGSFFCSIFVSCESL